MVVVVVVVMDLLVCCILLWALSIPTWPLGLAVTAGPAEAMLAGVLDSR